MYRLVSVAFILSLMLVGCGNDEASTDVGCWSEDEVTARDEAGRPMQWESPPNQVIDTDVQYRAVLKTSEGEITWELLPEAAPVTVNNFVCLARAGYYDGTPFHRILDGFVIQGGDPTGTGSGGPGYQFEDEPVEDEYVAGTVAMANAGADMNGSQFFIVLDDLRQTLPKNYNLFAQVIEGQEVVDAIAKTPTRPNERGEVWVPAEPVILESVTVSEGLE
jgi:cyclophilin family peptidyl-prolyl cis-trans isomerase